MSDEIQTETPLRFRQEINVEYTQLASNLGHNLCVIDEMGSQIKTIRDECSQIKAKLLLLRKEKAKKETIPG